MYQLLLMWLEVPPIRSSHILLMPIFRIAHWFTVPPNKQEATSQSLAVLVHLRYHLFTAKNWNTMNLK